MTEKEEETEKTFSSACQKLKEEVVKLKEEVVKQYNKPFLMLCTAISVIVAAIRTEREYSRELRYFNRTTPGGPSEIIYIALHSPLTLYEASEVYPLAQACQADKYQVAEFAYIAAGDVENIKRMLLQQAEEEYGNLCT